MQDQRGIAVLIPPMLESIARALCVDDDTIDRLLLYIKHNRPMLTEIRAAICEFYRIEPAHLLIRGRSIGDATLPRQIFCYFAFRYTRFSLGKIAYEVGVSDHTTVRYSVRKIERLALTKSVLADDLDLLRLRISEKVLMRSKGRC